MAYIRGLTVLFLDKEIDMQKYATHVMFVLWDIDASTFDITPHVVSVCKQSK